MKNKFFEYSEIIDFQLNILYNELKKHKNKLSINIDSVINTIREKANFLYYDNEEIKNEQMYYILKDFTSKKRTCKEIINFCNRFNYGYLATGDCQLWDILEEDLNEWQGLKLSLDFDMDTNNLIIIEDITTLNKRAKARKYYYNKKANQ